MNDDSKTYSPAFKRKVEPSVVRSLKAKLHGFKPLSMPADSPYASPAPEAIVRSELSPHAGSLRVGIAATALARTPPLPDRHSFVASALPLYSRLRVWLQRPSLVVRGEKVPIYISGIRSPCSDLEAGKGVLLELTQSLVLARQLQVYGDGRNELVRQVTNSKDLLAVHREEKHMLEEKHQAGPVCGGRSKVGAVPGELDAMMAVEHSSRGVAVELAIPPHTISVTAPSIRNTDQDSTSGPAAAGKDPNTRPFEATAAGRGTQVLSEPQIRNPYPYISRFFFNRPTLKAAAAIRAQAIAAALAIQPDVARLKQGEVRWPAV
ncbi:hypothetical protein ColTof3_14668 [Colletotrichum tofieldiae]|nr:hypothetical protein ColTof3_14668 [Colletotrichum tofieldiae]